MAKKINDSLESQATERPTAPVTEIKAEELKVVVPQAPQPRRLRIERQGSTTEPYTAYFPPIRAGVCDYCGILDPNVPSQYQYKLCPHYRGMDIRCSYCPDTRNPDEVNRTLVLQVHGHPTNPDTLVVVCNALECSAAHLKRFQVTQR